MYKIYINKPEMDDFEEKKGSKGKILILRNILKNEKVLTNTLAKTS